MCATDIAPLRSRPIIEVFEGKYACVDVGLLRRSVVDRVYFLVEKATTTGQFRSFFGAVFEWYVSGLFESFMVSSGALFRTYYASPKFVGGDEAADGIGRWDGTLAVMEFKAGLLSCGRSTRAW